MATNLHFLLAFGITIASATFVPSMGAAEICEPTLKAEQQALPALSRAARERIAANRAALKVARAQFSAYPPEIQIALARNRIPNLYLNVSFSTLRAEQRAAANEAARSNRAFRSALEQMANARTAVEISAARETALAEIEKNHQAYVAIIQFIPPNAIGVSDQLRSNRQEIANNVARNNRLSDLVKAYSRALEAQLG